MSLAGPKDIAIYLKEPPMPLTAIGPGDDPSVGASNAPVTVIIFSDYQCPACRRAHAVIEELRAAYKEKVRWVFKDYPLESHKGSDLAAVAARCAYKQGKILEYQDILFSAGEPPTFERLLAYAKQLNLDGGLFGACYGDPRSKAEVAKDQSEARSAGINQTPTFIVNGKLYAGDVTVENLKAIIQQELEEIGRKQEE
jgi:protein-disulfide isomerase